MMRTATYARFSSDSQRDASIDDQLRETGAVCARLSLPAPAVYCDAAISGSRQDRPEYLRLLNDAQRGAVDVLVLWDLKRLSRAEDLPQVLAQLRFSGVRVITCDGYDSQQEGSDLRGWVDAMMGNRYLHDLAKATHRGLMGQALKGMSAGGLPYGYRVAPIAGGNTRAIDPAQAEIVREIFREYAAGVSIRDICQELNRRGVTSPRGGTWTHTALYPDERGIGIVSNSAYVGRFIWNRSKWVKNPSTGRRIRKERPQSEWVITEQPDLAIITQAEWDAAQRRARAVRGKTKTAQDRHGAKARGGREPKYLFSGLLQCGSCGAAIVIVDRYRYGCIDNKNRGASVCGNGLRVARTIVEEKLLATVREDLLSEASYKVFEAEAREMLRQAQQSPVAARAALAKAERERDNIMAAIRQGIVTASTKSALEAAEHAAGEAQDQLRQIENTQPSQILPRARETWRRMVQELAKIEDVPRARESLKALLGDHIKLQPEDGVLVAHIGEEIPSEIKVVAGAGFEPTTFGL